MSSEIRPIGAVPATYVNANLPRPLSLLSRHSMRIGPSPTNPKSSETACLNPAVTTTMRPSEPGEGAES